MENQSYNGELTLNSSQLPSVVRSKSSITSNVLKLPQMTPRLYKRRFYILFLFCLFSLSNAFQWIQYSILTNIIAKFYNVDNIAVNWTSVIFMVVYIPLILPATWILDKKGLRYCMILGTFGNAVGAIIKCFSTHPNQFWITMIGQTMAAISQLFVLNIPARLAAVWFGEREVATATAAGVLGNQLGIALGFLVPTQVVKNVDSETVSGQLQVLFITQAIVTTVIFIMSVLSFSDKPKVPPSYAQIRMEEESSNYFGSINALMTNKDYVLLLVSYGINVGAFYSISTVLNQLVVLQFPNGEDLAGLMGLILTVAGTFGSVICGCILDRTRRFKEIIFLLYLFSLLSLVVFAIFLNLKVIIAMYPVSALLGFFMTGYLPIGFDLAAEITHPQPEGTSAGLLNASAQVFVISPKAPFNFFLPYQVFGIIFTFVSSWLIDQISGLSANLGFTGTLCVGLVLTWFIKTNLRRQQAQTNKRSLIGL